MTANGFIQNDYACLPITALHIISETVVLSGQGPYLRVTESRTGRVHATVRVFKGQAVHGIISSAVDNAQASEAPGLNPVVASQSHATPTVVLRAHAVKGVSQWRVLCWGGPSLTFLTLQKDSSTDHPFSLKVFCQEIFSGDWILHGSFAAWGGRLVAFLVTGHNELVSVAFDENKTQHVSNGVKSILYSAHSEWLSENRLLIAGGTVFGEVIVWSYHVDKTDTETYGTLHHIFRGHQGSIFGVCISHQMVYDDFEDTGPSRLLASCSDDRTIRVWDLSECSDSIDQSGIKSPDEQSAVYATGLGNNARSTREALGDYSIAIAWGHVSRIWGIQFLQGIGPSRNHIVHIISRGEDATCLLWRLQTSATKQSGQRQVYKLENMSNYAYHSGKNVWSSAITMVDSTYRLYSGGADGNLLSYDLDSHLGDIRNENLLKVEVSFQDLLQDVLPNHDVRPQSGSKKGVVQALKKYSFVGVDCFLAISDFGLIITGNINTSSKPVDWRPVAQIDDLKSYSIVAEYPRLGLVFIASASGEIRYYCHRDRALHTLLERSQKPSAIFIVDFENALGLLVTLPHSDLAQLILLESRNVEVSPFVTLIETKVLLLPATFFITSAYVVHDLGLLVVGSRSGALAVYNPKQSQEQLADLGCFRRIHGEDTVTCISKLRYEQRVNPMPTHLLTCGRDGLYAIHVLQFEEGCAMLQTVHRSNLPFGPNVEGVYHDAKGDLVFYGFRSKEFVVWNESQQEEMMAIDCGGAHRSWTYTPRSPNGGTFVWTKASTFNLYSNSEPAYKVVQTGGHGREIKAVAVRQSSTSGAQHQYMATGAEDTTIRIFTFRSSEAGQPEFRCVRVLKKHTTGIQHVQWSECGNYLFSSGGNEEFYVWRAREIPDLGLGMLCEASVPKENTEVDIRITAFDVRSWATATVDLGEWGRQCFMVSLMYSDSSIKVFFYDSTGVVPSFSLLHRGVYGTNCLTQAALVPTLSGIQLFSASTDGHVALYELPPSEVGDPLQHSMKPATRSISCHRRHQVHQSSVKAMATIPLTNLEVVLVTGGDDNALAFTRACLKPDDDSTPPDWSTIVIPKAHAAAINAITVFHDGPGQSDKSRRFTIVSSGNDQRVKVWKIEVALNVPGVGGIMVEKVANVFTAVADLSSIDVIEDTVERRSIVLCGIGMELWSLGTQ